MQVNQVFRTEKRQFAEILSLREHRIERLEIGIVRVIIACPGDQQEDQSS
jgi:hypothetical protein